MGTPSVDPRLKELLDQAGKHGEVEAVVLLDKGPAADAAASGDSRGVGDRVLDRVVKQVGSEPSYSRVMGNLGVLQVKGRADLVRALLEQKEVQSASSVEAEFTPLAEE